MKKWYQSKTIWINILMASVSILDGGKDIIPIDPKTQAFIILSVNVILRIITTKPITK